MSRVPDVPLPALCLSDPPKRYWIATDLDNLVTAMNLRTVGSLFSMSIMAATNPATLPQYLDGDFDYLPYVSNPGRSKIGAAPFSLTASRDYTVEVLLETVRKKLDPRLPSRLSAVFAFDTKKLATKAARMSGRLIDAVYQFELVENPFNRVARANFEVVSLLRRVIHQASWSVAHLEGIAEHYWRQGGGLVVEVPDPWRPGKFRAERCTVVWKYLIEGRLDRVGGPIGDTLLGNRSGSAASRSSPKELR